MFGATDSVCGGVNGAKDYVNSLCVKYSDGVYSTNGRCPEVDDINVITGFNPMNINEDDPYQTGTGQVYKHEDGDITTYGNSVTYTYNNSTKVLSYQSSAANGTYQNVTKFWPPNCSSNSTTILHVINKYYYYKISSRLGPSSIAYNMIIKNDDYVLASDAVLTRTENCTYGLFHCTTEAIGYHGLWGTNTRL